MATKTITIESGAVVQDLVSLLLRYLRKRPINGATLEIVKDALHQEEGWWYVPVRLYATEPPTYQYYDTLVEIEDEIAQQEHLKVLLVPSD